VKTQIWIAVSVYVLVAIVRKRLGLEPSLYTLLQVLSVAIFEKMSIVSSRLPSYSDDSESIGEDREFGEHGSVPLDQRQQSQFRHGGDQLVEHAALAEQRMGAVFGSV